MSETEKLLLTNFMLSSAAIRLLCASGVLDAEALEGEVRRLGGTFVDDGALGQAVMDAISAAKAMPRPDR